MSLLERVNLLHSITSWLCHCQKGLIYTIQLHHDMSLLERINLYQPLVAWQELVFSVKQQDLPYCKLVVAVWHRKKVAKDVHLGRNVVCSLIPRPSAWEWNQCHVLKSMVHAVHSFVSFCVLQVMGVGKAKLARMQGWIVIDVLTVTCR